MPTSLLLELALSLAGVGLLVAVSWMLGGWRGVRVTEETAAERLAFDEPDFRAGGWFVGADGASAAALSADGAEIALVFALGDSIATRRLARAKARIGRIGPALRFVLAEPSRNSVTLKAVDDAVAAHWLSQLTGAAI